MNHKKVGLYIETGWKTPLMFYQFECPIHGKVINYPMGYDKRLKCPICLNEEKQELGIREYHIYPIGFPKERNVL